MNLISFRAFANKAKRVERNTIPSISPARSKVQTSSIDAREFFFQTGGACTLETAHLDTRGCKTIVEGWFGG